MNGLSIKDAYPGVLKENMGSVTQIEDYFHLAMRFNLTAFHGDEIIKIGESLEKICGLYEEKIKKSKSESCRAVLSDFYDFRNTIGDKLASLVKEKSLAIENSVKRSKRGLFTNTALIVGGMYVLHRLNDLEHGQQEIIEDNIKHLKVLDSTIKHLALTAETVNYQGELLNKTIEKLKTVLFDSYEVKNTILNHITIYDRLRNRFDSKFFQMTLALNMASKNNIYTPFIMNEEFKTMIREAKINDNYRHIINIKEFNPYQIESLCEVTVYEEKSTPYIVISFPLTSTSTSNHFELIQLKPIPKLENDMATFIKLETNYIAYCTKNIGTFVLFNDLKLCKSFEEKYYCDHLNDFYQNTDNCITQILKSRHNDFKELSQCKLSTLKVSGINIVRLHEINSYLVISTKDLTTNFQGSLNLHDNNIHIIPKGVSILHSNEPGFLRFDSFKLGFRLKNQEIMKFNNKFSFYSYNYTTPDIEEILKVNPMEFQTVSSEHILSIDEINKISTEVNYLTEKSKMKLALMTTHNNTIYIVIALVVIVITIAICFFIMYYKIKKTFNIENIAQKTFY